MSASLIGWLITAVVALMLIYAVVAGIIRGMNKSIFRLVWLVCFAVILFFVATPIASVIGKMDISTLNLDIMGPVDKINDIGINLINELAKDNAFLANSEALKTFAEAVPSMILSIPIYLLLFYATKWVLWPVWAIIASLIFNKQKRKQKKFKKEQKRLAKETGEEPEEMPIELTVVKKKNRLGGALIGFVIGLVMCIVTFMPLIGINSIYQDVSSVKVTNGEGQQVSLIEDLIGDPEIVDYVSCFENSVASKFLTYTGVGFVSNAMFGYLTTTEVLDEKVSLKNEVTNLSKVYNDINTIMSLDFDSLNQEQLEKVLTSAKGIISRMKDSSLVSVLGNDIGPLFLNEFFDKEDFSLIDDGGKLDEVIKNSFANYSKNFDIKDLENQLESLVNVVSSLNNANLIAPLINGEAKGVDDIVTIMGNNIGYGSSTPKSIINGLYEVTLLKDSIPDLVQNGIEKLFESLELQDKYVAQEIRPNNLQENLQVIFSNLSDFAYFSAKSENGDFGTNTSAALSSLGNVIDALKGNILSEENYNVVIDYAIGEAKKTVTEGGDYSEEAVDKIETVLNSFKTVDSWNKELYGLSTLYSKITKLSNSDSSLENLLSSDNKILEGIGSGIKSAMTANSKIITNKNIRNLFEVVLEGFDSQEDNPINTILSIEVYEGATPVKLKDRLLNTIYLSTNVEQLDAADWENEFIYNVAVFKAAYKLIVGEVSVDDLSNSQNTILEDIGTAIDNAMAEVRPGKTVTKLIFTNSSMRGFINYLFDKWEMPSKADEIFRIKVDEGRDINVKAQVLSNIYNTANSRGSVTSWKVELGKIKNLLGEKFENTDLKSTGKVLDKIKGGKIFDSVILNSIVTHYVNEEVSTKGITYLRAGVDKMLSKLSLITTTDGYEFEFGNIDLIVKQVSAINNIDNPQDAELIAIGTKFDIVSNSSTGARTSVILDRETLNIFLKEFFDRYVNKNLATASIGTKSVADKIRNNIDDIVSYEKEIRYLLQVVKCMGNNAEDKNNDGVANIIDTGIVLDRMKDSVLINRFIVGSLIENFANENNDSLSQGLKDIIADVCERAKDKNVTIRDYEIEFGYIYELTQALNASIFSYSSVGEVLDKCAGINSTSSLLLPKQSNDSYSKGNINSIMIYYLDKFKTDKLTTTSLDDAENDRNSELADIVDDLKGEVNLIASYKTELNNLDDLFKKLNESNSDIAGVLDRINGTSMFLSKEIINRVVVAFFNKEASAYVADYGNDFITPMRNNLIAMTNSDLTYAQMFEDLETITGAFSNLDNVDSINSFTGKAHDLGAALDKMENIQTICDKSMAYKMANKIVDKVQGFIDAQSNTETKAALNTAMTFIKTRYDFDNYEENNYTFSGYDDYSGEYCTSMFSELGNSISTCLSGS